MKNTQIFHVDVFGRFALVTIVVFAPVLWFASDSVFSIVIIVAFIVAADIGTYFVCTVQVGPDGIVLYRVNRAPWQDITAAVRVSFFGLPYLKIQCKKGVKWWIPLYLRRPEEFRRALVAKAPAGNPLRQYAESDIQ